MDYDLHHFFPRALGDILVQTRTQTEWYYYNSFILPALPPMIHQGKQSSRTNSIAKGVKTLNSNMQWQRKQRLNHDNVDCSVGRLP